MVTIIDDSNSRSIMVDDKGLNMVDQTSNQLSDSLALYPTTNQ